MSFNIHAHDVAEKFFLLTHIPVKSFQLDGNPISSIGHTKKFERIFNTYNIYEIIYMKGLWKRYLRI